MLVKFLLAFAIALFLTYPAAILTTIVEGQSPAAIYSFHLPTSLFSYFTVSLPILFIFFCNPCHSSEGWNLFHGFRIKSGMTLLIIIAFYSVLVFCNLGRADILGDDYDLAYQAYNLHDGIQAARKAHILSFNTHPPLFMTIKHYWFQVLFPHGLETIPPWGYRGMEGIMGIVTILAVYAITKNPLAAAILAVNNYMILLGRVYLREIYLIFFLTLSIYFFLNKKYLIMAFLIGCGLLIKASAVIILPVYLLILFFRKEYKNIFKIISVILIIYLPVIFYNFLAFITIGRLDATFSKIFGLAHPFLTGSSPPLTNLFLIKDYLIDINGPLIFLLFLFSVVISFIRRQDIFYILILISSLLYFIFGGPLREYYLLFLTIPFVILTVNFFSRLFLIILILFSLWYSIFGNSAARKLYEPSRGWPKLVEEVKVIYQPGDCLEKSGGVNDLALRAYFQTDDAVKKALIGDNYPHYFKMCNEITHPAKKIDIFYNRTGQAGYRIL